MYQKLSFRKTKFKFFILFFYFSVTNAALFYIYKPSDVFYSESNKLFFFSLDNYPCHSQKPKIKVFSDSDGTKFAIF